MRNLMLLTATSLLLVGCAFNKLSPQGENVAVLQANEVGNCEMISSITANVTSKVVVNRRPEKVAQDLRIVARNRAAALGGDTLVATSAPRNGEQTFDLYRCRR